MLLHSMASLTPEPDWPHRLMCLIAENPTGDFAAMGFPDDWRKRPLWAQLCSGYAAIVWLQVSALSGSGYGNVGLDLKNYQ